LKFFDKKIRDLNCATVSIEVCGDSGSIVVYNQSFEKSRNTELAKDFPEYAANLEAINQRIIDLMEPFKNRLIYSPKQQSSYSIKYALPAFTNLNYGNCQWLACNECIS
jgi:hypothetical protein